MRLQRLGKKAGMDFSEAKGVRRGRLPEGGKDILPGALRGGGAGSLP